MATPLTNALDTRNQFLGYVAEFDRSSSSSARARRYALQAVDCVANSINSPLGEMIEQQRLVGYQSDLFLDVTLAPAIGKQSTRSTPR